MGACHCKGSVETTNRTIVRPRFDPQRVVSLILDDYGFLYKNDTMRLIDLSRESEGDQILAARWKQTLSDSSLIADWRERRDSEWILTRIPAWLRQRVWVMATGASTIKRQSSRSFNDYVNSADQLTKTQVETDAPRTFSDHPYFTESSSGRQRLTKLLHAIAARLGPDIGYVQGMNMVAAIVLFVVDDDEDAFWILVAFMESLNMKQMYADGLRALTESLNRLGQTISSSMPGLTKHFGEENLEPFCYGTPWFLTMFAYNLPVRQTVRLYDVAFLTGKGPELVHHFALTIVKFFESELLKLSFTESTSILKNVTMDDERLERLLKEAVTNSLEHDSSIEFGKAEEGGEILSRDVQQPSLGEKVNGHGSGNDWDIPGAIRSATAEALKTADADSK